MELFHIPNHIHEPVRARGFSDHQLSNPAARIRCAHGDSYNISDDQTAP